MVYEVRQEEFITRKHRQNTRADLGTNAPTALREASVPAGENTGTDPRSGRGEPRGTQSSSPEQSFAALA